MHGGCELIHAGQQLFGGGGRESNPPLCQVAGDEGDDDLLGNLGNDELDGGSGSNSNDGGLGEDYCVNPDRGAGALNCESPKSNSGELGRSSATCLAGGGPAC
jgi:Ca2+-binding RTX toxin-like protein